jgi:predicted PurR-regulated permease PerM
MKEDPGGGSPGPAVSWRDLHLWQIQPVRDLLLALAVIGLFWLGDRISLVTVPLLLAILLAYLFEPVVAWMEKRSRLGRPGIVALLLGSVVLLVVVPTVIGIGFGVAQGAALLAGTAQRVDMVYQSVRDPENPQLIDRVAQDAGPAWSWIRERIVENTETGDTERLLEAVQTKLRESATAMIGSTASAGAVALRSAVGFVGGAFAVAFSVFLTGFFFYFVSTGWGPLRTWGLRLLPAKHESRILDLAGKFDAVVSGFVRGRLTIAFVQAVVFSILYWLIGVPAAFILGPVVAILSIVPYLALVGLPVSVTLLWLEGHDGFRGAWWWVLGAPAAVYFLGQALDDYVLTPVIQGKSTNMDTPTILFATIAGGALFGVFGMLIAIPLAACVKIVVVELLWPRFREWAEGRAPDPLPIDED